MPEARRSRCIVCGKPVSKGGYDGFGLFHSKDCAAEWAVSQARIALRTGRLDLHELGTLKARVEALEELLERVLLGEPVDDEAPLTARIRKVLGGD